MLLSVTQIARQLGIHQQTVRMWIRKGRVEHIRIGSHAIRVDEKVWKDFIERSTVKANPSLSWPPNLFEKR